MSARDITEECRARVIEVGTFGTGPGVMLDVKGHGKVLMRVTEAVAREWGGRLFDTVRVEIRVTDAGGES